MQALSPGGSFAALRAPNPKVLLLISSTSPSYPLLARPYSPKLLALPSVGVVSVLELVGVGGRR
eukprot:1792479-Rhodomonas_salina.1